ncbi:hypothetical protein THASP1DRAFT_32556 [Thamnocephalis sphaerospora]|uniref:F-box domain-containing protein n=1 Tax=Thamnocephalis sphaerospora TaxID=78915 RepID=A0A4P9XK57_9FUNG|nr:hypothetical protein THASP1DRAFT_32556 [Thamnocephalis sphaerospora]|eukprot:RKP05610.1 hypothetical protein THASP1DRAFT_32556 [Thamnocephalis sphaerospora]
MLIFSMRPITGDSCMPAELAPASILERLPVELHLHIIRHLDGVDVVAIGCASRRWQRWLKQRSNHFWRSLYERTFPPSDVERDRDVSRPRLCTVEVFDVTASVLPVQRHPGHTLFGSFAYDWHRHHLDDTAYEWPQVALFTMNLKTGLHRLALHSLQAPLHAVAPKHVSFAWPLAGCGQIHCQQQSSSEHQFPIRLTKMGGGPNSLPSECLINPWTGKVCIRPLTSAQLPPAAFPEDMLYTVRPSRDRSSHALLLADYTVGVSDLQTDLAAPRKRHHIQLTRPLWIARKLRAFVARCTRRYTERRRLRIYRGGVSRPKTPSVFGWRSNNNKDSFCHPTFNWQRSIPMSEFEKTLRQCAELARLCGENLRCLNESLEMVLDNNEPALDALHATLASSNRTDTLPYSTAPLQKAPKGKGPFFGVDEGH